MAIDKKKLKNLDLWGKDDTTVTTTTGKTYKMSQVGTKNYTVNQQKAAENKAAMAKAEQVHKQAQAKAQQQQKAQQKAQIKTTAADRVKKSLLSMPEMTDYTRESVQPDKYDTTPGTLPKIKNVLRRADNAGASILAKQLGSKEAAIKTAAIGVKSKATSLLGGNESDRYKRQMSALSSKYGVRAATMPEYKLAQLNYNNALAKEKIKSRQAILKATKSADDYKTARNAALDGLTGGKRTAANFLMGAGDMGADIALLGATGAVGGAAAMGLGAMGDKARQVALKGGTTDDALKAGLLSGGVSAAVNYAVPKALGKVGALAPKALPTYRNSILAGEDLIRSGNSGYISGLKGLNSELAKTVLSNAAKEGVHGSAFGVANTLGQGAANALLGEQTGITPGSLVREAGTGFIMGAGMGGIRGGIGAYGASRGNKAYAEGFANEYNKHYDELRGDLRKGLLDRQVQQTPLMLGTTNGTLGEKIVNDAKNTPLALPKGADFTVDSEGNITKFQNPTEPIKAYNDDKITKYEERNSKTVPSIDNVKYEESSNPYEDFSRYLEATEGTYSEDDIAKVKSMWADIDKNYNGNPSAYAIDIADKFEKLYKEEVNYLANKFYKYKPKGVDIIQVPSDSRSAILGTIPRRISNNDKWYSDAYKKYGHTPTKSDRLDYAKNLIESDLNDGKGVYASPELRELHNKFNDIIKYGRTLDGKYGSFQEATKDANNDYVLHFGTKYEGLPEPTANEPYPVYDGKQSLVGGKTLGGKINKAWAEKNTTPGELPTETVGNKETLPKESNGVFTDNPAQKELLAQKNTVKADYSKVTPNIKTRVENINGTRREYISNTNEARKDFIKYARENFPESVTVKSNGMKVDISRKGLDKLLSGKILKEKYASSFYVPELVENAYGSTYSKYNKPYGKTKENIEGYTYMKSNINIDGTSYTAHIRIRTSNDSNHYYGHTLSGTIDDIKIEPLDADGHNKIATSWPVTSANDSNQSISNNSLDVNVKSTTPGELTTYGKGTVGAAEANPNSINSQLEELSAKYGSIPYGEEPRARVDNIPKSIDGKTRVSQFARTMIENPATPDSFVKELEQDVLDGKFSRAIVTDPDALAKAQNSLNSSTGYKKLYDEKFTKELYDLKASNIKDKFAMGKLIYEEAIKTGDEETATRVTGDLTTLANLSGQGLQAVRLMKKMTPDGNLYALEKTVKGLNEKRAEKRFFKPKEKIKINPELAEKLLKSKSKEEMVKNVEDIQKDISSQMDSSLLEAIDEWRHFAMLANPTTHLKNTSGNAATAMLYRAKDVIGTGLEKTVNEISKATGHGEIEKTKSIMMPIKSKEDKALVDFAKSDYETNMKDIATSAGSGKVNMKSAIEKHKNVFNSNPIGKALNKIPVLGKGTKAVGNVLDKATKGNSALLDAEDNFFIKQNYTNALSKYMKANKYTPEYLKSAEGSEALSKAQDYALKQALEATFHDDNIIATGLNKLINSNSFVKFLGDAFIPYKKTPLNIARRAVEYSPVGLAKGTRDFAKSTRNWGSSETTNAIDELAKGLTGSGLMALGFLASHKGYLTSGLTDDKKLNGLEKAEGKQNFALNLKDYTVSLESFSPAAIPLLAGAGLYETMSKGDKLEPGAVVDTLGALLSPMVEMSVLSSIDSLITDVSYAKQGGEDILTAGIGSAAKSYAGQLMPTSLSKLSNTLDDTKRSSSYIDKNKSTGKIIQGIENQYKYKNPLTHKQLPPALDVWGREQKTKSAAVRVVNNFLNPTTVKKKNITAVDKEVERLYKSTGDSEVIPSLPNKYMNYKNTQGNQVRKDFTANEYTKYVKERNNATLKDIDGLIKTQEYKNLSDEDKAKVISGLFDYNNDKAKGDLAKDYEIQKSTAKIDDIVASTGMSKANAILYRQTLSNMDKGGKDADEINDYLFNNNSLTAQQKNKLSQEYVKDYVFVNRQKDIDFSNKESYEVSQMSESARKHYNEAKKMGYNAQSYQKAYDIVSKQKENYTKDSKIADLQKQCGMSHTQAIEFWDMLKKKKK